MAPRLARIPQVAARLRAIVGGYLAHALSDLALRQRYVDLAESKPRLCPPVDRTRRAYVTLDAIVGCGV
jgi:hypothetical protein